MSFPAPRPPLRQQRGATAKENLRTGADLNFEKNKEEEEKEEAEGTRKEEMEVAKDTTMADILRCGSVYLFIVNHQR